MTELDTHHEPPQPPQPSAGGPNAPDRRITLALLAALIVLAGLAGGWSLLVVILSIVVMIVLHELGHFITAKKSGMKVTEFFLGFGPKLWSFRRGETEYGVKAIPAGAYVRIIGMNNLEEVAPEDEPRTYRQQSYPKRFAVAVAGSGMHFLQAIVAMFLVFTIFGAPGGHLFTRNDPPYSVDNVSASSPAERAGVRPGDRFVTLDGEDVSTLDKLHEALATRASQPVQLVVDRGGQRLTLDVMLGERDGHGLLGVELQNDTLPLERTDPFTATGRTFRDLGALSKETVGFFGSFFSPSGISDFTDAVLHPSSPTVSTDRGAEPSGGTGGGSSNIDENRPVSIIGAARFGSEITREGPFAFFAFFASINVVIGLFNLIPLLPLDGGHLAIATYERLRSRKGRRYHADVVKLMPITYAVVLLLILLGVSTVFLDIVNPITLN